MNHDPHQISFICDVQASITCKGGTSTSTSSSDPWSGQQGYLTDVFSKAQNLDNSYTPQYYQDSTVAGMNGQQTGAINDTYNLGTNGSSAINAANNALTSYANGSMLGTNNPAFQNVAAQTAASVTPGLMSSFTQGTTDNPNVALAASNGVANAVGNLAYQNYGMQTGNQLEAANDASNLYNTQLSGLSAAYGAGQDLQTQAQNQLTDQVNRYNYYQQLPYTQLNQYANTVQGQYGNTTTTSSPNQSLLGSLFSDVRLKCNIRAIGKADNGHTIYAYQYKGDSFGKTHLGFLAQEIQRTHPGAIHVHKGHLMIDYAKAVLPAEVKNVVA